MRRADLRPGDGCGGPLFAPSSRWIQVVRTSGALIGPTALQIVRAAGRHGVPLQRLVDSGDAVQVLGDQNPFQLDELLLCVTCYHSKPIAELVRLRREELDNIQREGMVS